MGGVTPNRPACGGVLAERVGFEPTEWQAIHLISNQARSTGLRHLSGRRILALIAVSVARLCRSPESNGLIQLDESLDFAARRASGCVLVCPAHQRWKPNQGAHWGDVGGKRLARDDLIEATGTVDKILGGGRYQITLESGQVVTAQLSGRMRRFRIRVIPGDRVTVGLSPYDPSHGFITFRLREGQAAR